MSVDYTHTQGDLEEDYTHTGGSRRRKSGSPVGAIAL